MASKRILGYDRALLPDDMTIKEVIDKYKSEGIVYYDSKGTNKIPFLYNREDENDTFEDIIFNDLYNKTEDNG
jgi:hypothetical protein